MNAANTKSELEDRIEQCATAIERLNRVNGRYRWGLVLLAATMLFIFAGGAAKDKDDDTKVDEFDTVRAKKLEIVNGRNEVVCTIHQSRLLMARPGKEGDGIPLGGIITVYRKGNAQFQVRPDGEVSARCLMIENPEEKRITRKLLVDIGYRTDEEGISSGRIRTFTSKAMLDRLVEINASDGHTGIITTYAPDNVRLVRLGAKDGDEVAAGEIWFYTNDNPMMHLGSSSADGEARIATFNRANKVRAIWPNF